MTLKSLCKLYKSSYNIFESAMHRTLYMIGIDKNINYDNVTEDDIRDLRTYLLCDILVIQ